MKPTQPPHGKLYWLAGLLAIAALVLAFFPLPEFGINGQIALILGLVVAAGVLLQLNLSGGPKTVRRQNLAHVFFLGGVILLPLHDGEVDLPGYAGVVSVACTVIFLFLTWKSARDKQAAGKEMAPPDRYTQ